jgi:hypothetical protein
LPGTYTLYLCISQFWLLFMLRYRIANW